MSTLAAQSRSRPAIASLAYPEKIGVKMAPIADTASTATTH